MVNTIDGLSGVTLPESFAAKVEAQVQLESQKIQLDNQKMKLESQSVDNFRRLDTFLLCLFDAMKHMNVDMLRYLALTCLPFFISIQRPCFLAG
jgi:hypothetical protein